MTCFLGMTSFDSLAEVQAKAVEAYEKGANTLFVAQNGSFHDSAHSFYAKKVGARGRKVSNPKEWLRVAYETSIRRDIDLIAMSRKGG